MSADSIFAIRDRFKAMIPATQTDQERIDLLLDYIRALAADRAQTVFLACETEAANCIETEDRYVLRQRLEATVAMAGCEFAAGIGHNLPGTKGPGDRAPFEHFAAIEYQRAFDGLLRTVRGGGRA